MKTLFIPAKIKYSLDNKEIKKIQSLELSKKIAIAYSIQYKDMALNIRKALSKTHKITKIVQVLGCSKPRLPKETQAILLLSDGRFHAISLALETGLPIYILEHNKLTKISKQEIKHLKNRQKASYLKFLNADKIGILISIKPGQENLKKALVLKKTLKDKKSYLFIGDTINPNEFENFPINVWINTACPRLDMDINLLNISEIKRLGK